MAVMANLLLAAPALGETAVHAEGRDLRGMVHSDRLDFGADANIRARPMAMLLEGQGSALRLHGHATRLVLNESSMDWHSVGGGSDGALRVSQRPRESRETVFEAARLEVEATGAEATIGMDGAGEDSTGELRLGSVSIRAAKGETWRAGQPGTTTDDADQWVHHDLVITRGTPILVSQAASGSLHGTFVLYLWDVRIVVVDQHGGHHEFKAGSWSDNAVGPGPDGVARQKHTRFVRMEVSGLDARLEEPSRARIAAAEVQAETSGDILLSGATGSLDLGGQSLEPGGRPLAVRGPSRFTVGASEDRLAVLFGPPTPNEADPLFTARRTNLSRPAARILTALSLALVIFGAARVVGERRRTRASLIDRAEDALHRRRARQVLEPLRQRLGRRRADPDTLFVYAAAVFQAQGPEAAVNAVEPRMAEVEEARRPGLAFLLAVAHARLGRPASALAWIDVAALDPVLRERIRIGPEFDALRPDARFQRLVDGSAASYG